jgi:hypothetical protein
MVCFLWQYIVKNKDDHRSQKKKNIFLENESATDYTYVSKSLIEGAGKGCFVSCDVEKNASILKIDTYIVLQSEFAIERAACPDDEVIRVIRGTKQLRVLDKPWFAGCPKWYLINHSSLS